MPVLATLVKTGSIVKATAEALHRLLLHYDVSIRKNTTKTAKVKELMKLAVVIDHTTSHERQRIEETLAEMDSKRNKRQSAQAADADAEEEAGTWPTSKIEPGYDYLIIHGSNKKSINAL